MGDLPDKGSWEALWFVKAKELQDPLKVPSFVAELINTPGLDVAGVYMRIEGFYNINRNSAVLYEILCRLGEKPFAKGQTISRVAEQHAVNNRALLQQAKFS